MDSDEDTSSYNRKVVTLNKDILSQNVPQGDHLGTTLNMEIAFVRISRVDNLHYCHNLRELVLVDCGIESIVNVEPVAHSLEILEIFGGNMKKMEHLNCLTNLRVLKLVNHSIKRIESINGLRKLQYLYLYSNKIRQIENISDCINLRELHLEDNKIEVVEGISTLNNLEVLDMSQNPIVNLHDVNEVSTLPLLKKLYFSSECFDICPICEINGYRSYVLSLVQSTLLEVLDKHFVTDDELENGRNDYLQEMLSLQDSLEAIESEHKKSLLYIESKDIELSNQIETVRDGLVEELHHLRGAIESGKEEIISESERLKDLRDQSEDTLKEEFQEIQYAYSKEVTNIVKYQQDSIQKEEDAHHNLIQMMKMEKELSSYLIDLLYSSNGALIYNEVNENFPEFRYLQEFIKTSDDGSKHAYILSKAFNTSNTQQDISTFPRNRYFAHEKLETFKTFFLEQRLPERSLKLTKSIGAVLRGTQHHALVFVFRVNTTNDEDGEPPLEIHVEAGKEKDMICEYICLITIAPSYDSVTKHDLLVDERVFNIISNPLTIPTKKLADLKDLEKDAWNKYEEHQKRLWGELEPESLSKFKSQEEEIKNLMDMVYSIQDQIQNENNTQDQLLKELRLSVIDSEGKYQQAQLTGQKKR
eukprot:CAMPEP_0114988892 /NCGR_PEP_ID=MMETSP0216-20121206/9876_1 /TAXON_ID=223996 /ORGANISM="Protocruzia adherens, Strain Boccale" /LENGTH=644 /DNA_ID=CAMNT_0002351773 /DNA_START=241 /DNA_END=2175 /DNA_ORIENTATION=+